MMEVEGTSSYSYQNDLGYKLRNPLFSLVTKAAVSIASIVEPNITREHLTVRVSKVAVSCFKLTLLMIPCGIAWLAGKMLAKQSKIQINPNGLCLGSLQVRPPDEESIAGVDIQDLIDKAKNAKLAPELIQNLVDLCERTTQQSPEFYTDDSKRSEFYKKLMLCLKGITQKLSAEDFPRDREKDILQELAEAAGRCSPTWLETASKLLLEIESNKSSAEIKLLKAVQDYKEALILEVSQVEAGVQWHALNVARVLVGDELGLNTNLSELDPYIQAVPNCCKKIVRWMFFHRYQDTNRLISGVANAINSKPYDLSYFNLLQKIACEQGMDPASVGERFYTEDSKNPDVYLMNALGVETLLRYLGVLA